jgi:hypothetical protein
MILEENEVNKLTDYISKIWEGFEDLVDNEKKVSGKEALKEMIGSIYNDSSQEMPYIFNMFNGTAIEWYQSNKMARENHLKSWGYTENAFPYDNLLKTVSSIYYGHSNSSLEDALYRDFNFEKKSFEVMESISTRFSNAKNLRPVNSKEAEVYYKLDYNDEYLEGFEANIKQKPIKFEATVVNNYRNRPITDKLSLETSFYNKTSQGRGYLETLVGAIYSHSMGITAINNWKLIEKELTVFEHSLTNEGLFIHSPKNIFKNNILKAIVYSYNKNSFPTYTRDEIDEDIKKVVSYQESYDNLSPSEKSIRDDEAEKELMDMLDEVSNEVDPENVVKEEANVNYIIKILKINDESLIMKRKSKKKLKS